ncbi:MAG: hypothetical protein AVDCRST_MAG67-2259, partial [uncultured Solirubrobacteraceae bacterium]
GEHPQRRAGSALDRRDLPRAHALRQGRRPVGRLRRRQRRRPVRRRFARRAQPQPLDDRVRHRVRAEHDHPAEDL